ncbi:Alpha/Beta hydrolase protein [Xylariaceae sp. FL1651]|nr:Alpha/Beta hydrolase protein [Xylariaceae sp. FL1651]
MAPIWSKQPFKALYTTYYLLTTLAILPWLLVRYSTKYARPYAAWNFSYCLVNAIGRGLFTFYTQTRTNGMSSVLSDHKKAGERYALLEPAEPSLYTGVLAPRRTAPAPIGGLWYPAPLLAKSLDIKTAKVVLHFPGGAFVRAYGQEYWGKPVSSAILNFSAANFVLFAQYRLSVDDSTRFPAALQDAVTAYNYILRLGVEPKNIILSGDSAGGNLVLALLRYLETPAAMKALPLPCGAMIWSPWVRVSLQAGAEFDSSKNSANDVISAPILQWGAEAYLPKPQPTAEELAYISPLEHPFHLRVPLFIQSGTAEGFHDNIREFANNMSSVDGNHVRWHATDFATHDMIMAYEGFGFEGDMEAAMRDAFHFFES